RGRRAFTASRERGLDTRGRRRLRQPHAARPRRRRSSRGLEHDPEKCEAVFRKRSCSIKSLKRDDDSIESHRALAAPTPASQAGGQPSRSASSWSVGTRPAAFFETASRPSALISNTPPPDRRRLTSAEGRSLRNKSRAARARGS